MTEHKKVEMSFRENDLELIGDADEDLDWQPFATATVGAADTQQRRTASDPYLSLYLIQDYTYVSGLIRTELDSETQYVNLLS